MSIVPHMQRGARYTIGERIEHKFLDLLDLSYLAYFTEKEKKQEKVVQCILLLDTLKFLVSIVWEGKLVSNSHYTIIATKLDETGKMLGGWRNSLNYPNKKNRTL